MRITLGVDGGGTKTACVVMDYTTRVVMGQGVAGSSNKNRCYPKCMNPAVETGIIQTLSARNPACMAAHP
jgi:N-acetylglucosamine kinase-like BadF-type ATPase